jgi:hypothetical protein
MEFQAFLAHSTWNLSCSDRTILKQLQSEVVRGITLTAAPFLVDICCASLLSKIQKGTQMRSSQSDASDWSCFSIASLIRDMALSL